MATVNSDQVAKLVSAAPRKLGVGDGYAKPYRLTFTYTVPAGTQAIGDVLRTVKLPSGARVVDFWFGWGALSTGVGVAGADVGLTGDGQRYLAALNMDAAGEKRAAYVVDKMPDQTAIADDETYFLLTVTGEAWAAAAKIQGWVEVLGLA